MYDQLTPQDCRACFRLIHEACELGNDPVAWNTHVMQSLEPLLKVDASNAYIVNIDLDIKVMRPKLFLLHNIDASWSDYVDEQGAADQPHTPGVMARLGTDFVATRQELIDDQAWYASPWTPEHAHRLGWDQFIMSQVFVKTVNMVHGLTFPRRIGAPAFEREGREVQLLRFIHAELAHLWRKPEAIEIDTLPSRLMDTVAAMRRGMSRKEIANEMGISPHTVHTYERQLFEKFGVSSRGELLARLAKAIRPTLIKQGSEPLGHAAEWKAAAARD